MSDNNKSYYAVIPASVRYDESLPPNAKLLYGEITALCNKDGCCWASNKYFAELYGVSVMSISKWINALANRGYIATQIIYKEGTKQIDKRYITILYDPIKEKFNTSIKNLCDPTKEKFNTPIKEKLKDNNTVYNNTFNITKEYKRKNNKKEKSDKPTRKIFIPPTLEEVQAYCVERNNNVDAKKFFDYYTAADWYDAKGDKVKSWKQKVITWERSDKVKETPKQADKPKTNNPFYNLLLDESEGIQ